MTKYARIAVALVTLIASLAFVAQSQASISLSAWSGSPIQLPGTNTTWTLVSTNLPDVNTTVTVVDTGLSLALTFDPQLGGATNTYTMRYVVSIDPAALHSRFATATMDSNQTASVTNVTKVIRDSTETGDIVASLVSVSGVPCPIVSLPGALRALYVEETYTFDSNGKLYSVTNTFTEGHVPEPATCMIWSLLGGVGAIVGWRRRQRGA